VGKKVRQDKRTLKLAKQVLFSIVTSNWIGRDFVGEFKALHSLCVFGGTGLVDLEVLSDVFANQTMIWEFESDSMEVVFSLTLHGQKIFVPFTRDNTSIYWTSG